ncbi:MAG: prepilin peptidase [Rickettsiales bacterium]
MTAELWPICVIAFVFGLQFGSFATLASYRIPRGEDIVFTPSRCPSCLHRLGIADLFPLFSWLKTGGKCRHCAARVSARYPTIETLVGLYVAALAFFWLQSDSGVLSLALRALGSLILIVTLIMLTEGRRVPPYYYLAYHAATTAALAYFPALRVYAAPYAAIVIAAFYLCPKLGNRFPALRLYAGMAAGAPLCFLTLYANGAGTLVALAIPLSLVAATAAHRSLLRKAETAITVFLIVRTLVF